MTATTPLSIDVVSDVVCPWCYIGKRLLEKAIALKPDIPVEVRFRPYFLNPWVPREGMSREDYLIAKFGSVERYNSNNQRVVDAANYAGLTYARDLIKRQPNTLDCHRLILWAGGNGGRDETAADGDLFQRRRRSQRPRSAGAGGCRLRHECRRGARTARRASDDIERIEAEANSAKDAGIDGVPCFIFGGLFGSQRRAVARTPRRGNRTGGSEVAQRVAAE